MSYGICLRDAVGSILTEFTGQPARTVYRQSLGAITNGMATTMPGLDPTRGVVFVIMSGNAFGEVPLYVVSGNVVTFHWNGSFGTTYVLHTVMSS